MAEFIEIFEAIGLVKNEARIYEALLREGESGVGHISTKSGVHRRNVYDTLNKLIEKGLVFERITSAEHLYTAVNPKKLVEIIKEKEHRVCTALPDLEKLYESKSHVDEVIVYKGIEGWKNYLRDMISVGEDVYSIGAKGTWQDKRIEHACKQLAQKAKESDMRMRWIFDPSAKDAPAVFIEQGFNLEYRFLPEGYNSATAIDIYGDRVVIVTDPTPGKIMEDTSFTVLINQHTADSFRTWFGVLWQASK
jgi:sugar-specific transcriptional regulator TrmB